jgi:hypothetical protein
MLTSLASLGPAARRWLASLPSGVFAVTRGRPARLHGAKPRRSPGTLPLIRGARSPLRRKTCTRRGSCRSCRRRIAEVPPEVGREDARRALPELARAAHDPGEDGEEDVVALEALSSTAARKSSASSAGVRREPSTRATSLRSANASRSGSPTSGERPDFAKRLGVQAAAARQSGHRNIAAVSDCGTLPPSPRAPFLAAVSQSFEVD